MAKKRKMSMGGEYVYGVHAVQELLHAKRRKVYAVYTLEKEPKIYAHIQPLLPYGSLPVHRLTRHALTEKAGTADHQGIMLFVQQYPYRKKMFDAKKAPFLVLLDGIQDVRNVGAIIRSMYCVGANGLVIAKKHGAPISPAAVKASAGLAEHVQIYQAASIEQAIQEIVQAGYHVYATMPGKKMNDSTATYTFPLCIVIGNEAHGISPVVKKIGFPITLAQKNPDISYNAAVAAGIVLYLVAHHNRLRQTAFYKDTSI